MAQFSKEQLSFVEEIPKQIDIECPICLNILRDPHQVTCCGHNFCESCIKKVKASNGACPMCKEKKYQSFADKNCIRIINGLQVYCLNQKEGCQWKGELKYLSTHTNQGKREGQCLYQEVKCRYKECGSKGQRQYIGYHEQRRCPQRPFKCEHCNTKGSYRFITEKHYFNCSKYPVPCPNECTSTLISRDNVPAHLTHCPLQPVDCVFSWAGCKERPLRKDIELHTTDTKHMMILAVACGELKKENETLKKTCDQLKKEDEALQKACDQLKKEDETLKKTCDTLQKTCDQVKEEDETLKKEHAYTRDLLVVVAADTLPILPITVTCEEKIVHFYTEIGGYHMSATFMSHVNARMHERPNVWMALTLSHSRHSFLPNTPPTVYLAFHEGKFDRIMKHVSYPKICFIHDDATYPFEVTSYQKTDKFSLSLLLDSSGMSTTTPAGIISWAHPHSKSDRYCRYRISSLQITLMEHNKLAVHVKSRHRFS